MSALFAKTHRTNIMLCHRMCAHQPATHKKTARTPCARRSCLRRMIYRFITGISIYADARPVAVAVAPGVAHSKADKRLTSAAHVDAHARASRRAMCLVLPASRGFCIGSARRLMRFRCRRRWDTGLQHLRVGSARSAPGP